MKPRATNLVALRAAFVVLLFSLTLSSSSDTEHDNTIFDQRQQSARAALNEGRLEDADRLYRELITLFPHRVGPYQGLAEVFAARGKRDEALALLLETSHKLLLAARWSDALGALELAIVIDPERAEAHALLGQVHRQEQSFHDAVACLRRAVELGSSELSTLMDLAASYKETGQLDEAESVYLRALDDHPNANVALSRYGQFLLWRGRTREAVKQLEQALALGGDDLDTLAAVAQARSEVGNVDGAIIAYQRLLTLLPENKQPHTQQARHALELLRHRRGKKPPEPPTPAPRRRPDQEPSKIVLTPVAMEAGLDFRHHPGVTPERHLPETMGSGLAWLDYDGDGWLDLYLVQSGPFPPTSGPRAANRLFRHRGDGTFEDVTERSGTGESSYGQGALAADVDGDGDVDLFVTNYGPDVLLLNRGDGTFENATARLGLTLPGWSSSAAMADADGDGDLDLYVTGYVDYDPKSDRSCGEPNAPDYCNVVFFTGTDDAFFRQGSGGLFEEVTLESGFDHIAGRGLGVVFTDLDGDHRPDIYVANDLDPNRLYRNLGDGRFEDVSLLSGAAMNREGQGEAGMGVAVGDVDGDGRPELTVTNFDIETNTLYRNLGDLHFADISAVSGFGIPSFNLLGFGIVLKDLDLDGDLDAYMVNGHVFEHPTRDTVTRAQHNLLMLGDGQGRFVKQPTNPNSPPRIGRGLATADYDKDGDADLAVQHSGDAPELLRNETKRQETNRWLGVELVGQTPNHQAIGARVTLRTDRRRLVRWVMAGGSYQSSNDRRLVFGWTSGERVEELEVVWPSGEVFRLRTLPTGRYHRVVEN